MCTFVCIFMACMVSIWLHIRTAVVHLAHLCTMTWSVDNVIAEIKDVGQLLHFKRQNGASNMDHLEATLIKNITCKLETMFLSPTQALSVQKALHEDVNLTPDMKASVNASIDASLTRDSNNNESAHGPKPQKINVSPYLTMSDWDIIKNSQNYHSKVAAVCKRLGAWGWEVWQNSQSSMLWVPSCLATRRCLTNLSCTRWCKTSNLALSATQWYTLGQLW